jgi:hypothetical protein
LLERRPAEGERHQPADGSEPKRGKRKRGLVSPKTLERYDELLRCHVVPKLGARPLQQIQATEIDALYVELEQKLSPRTVRHVHTVLGACLKAAVRKKLLAGSSVIDAEAPSPGEGGHGIALEADQLRTLVNGFRTSVLFPIVAVGAFTGVPRGEILAPRWVGLDVANRRLRIERSVEKTKKYGLALKEPKRDRRKRTIAIDHELVTLLCAARARHLRLIAGIPEGASVDLSLVRLPADALMFPNPPERGEDFSSPGSGIRTTCPRSSAGGPPSSASRTCAFMICGARRDAFA